MKKFEFKPAEFIPFRDKAVLEKIRGIGIGEIENHPNPDFKIKVVKDDEAEFIMIADMFQRIYDASVEDRKVVNDTPQSGPRNTRKWRIL